MIKQTISAFFRKLGLSHMADNARFRYFQWKNKAANKAFKKAHPKVVLPPDYLMYESFQLDYQKYFEGGRETAKWVIDHFKKHIIIEDCVILDWGCGPGRIIRHMPDLLDDSNKLLATDYNPKSIQWCGQNIPRVAFNLNGVNPPLNYEDDSINILYSISIFTHLSENNHWAWLKELHRIIDAKKSCLLITTHGDAYCKILTESEKKKYQENKLVIRSNAIEGQRVFGAFHPPSVFRKMLLENKFEILEHIPGIKKPAGYIEQDVWMVRKSYGQTA